MSQLDFLIKGLVFMLVFTSIIVIMARDHKGLSFAETEWETLEESFGAGPTEDIIEESELDTLPTADPPVTEESPPWWANIPVIGQAAQFVVDVGAAIWGFVLTVAEMFRTTFRILGAVFKIFWLFVTFDVPALRENMALRIFLIIVIAPFWIGIPYIMIRLIRGGG